MGSDLELIVDGAIGASFLAERAESLKKLVQSETGREARQLAISDPARFEQVMRRICGSNAAVVFEEILERLFKYVLPGYDISVYAMRCEKRGQYARMVKGYQKMADAGDMLLKMQNRDHVACCFTSRVHHDLLVYSFMLRGLRNNQLNVLVVNSQEKRKLELLLSGCGIDVASLVKSGRLVIMLHEELYGDDLGSSFEPVRKQLIKAQKLAKKMSGMNVIGTIAGNLAIRRQYERCAQIEKAWHELIPEFSVPITLLCPYPASTVTRAAKAGIVPSHNRGLVCEAHMHA